MLHKHNLTRADLRKPNFGDAKHIVRLLKMIPDDHAHLPASPHPPLHREWAQGYSRALWARYYFFWAFCVPYACTFPQGLENLTEAVFEALIP